MSYAGFFYVFLPFKQILVLVDFNLELDKIVKENFKLRDWAATIATKTNKKTIALRFSNNSRDSTQMLNHILKEK